MPRLRKPRVYLDTSCFGRLIESAGAARNAALALIAEIEHNQLTFLDSAWLRKELDEAQPESLRRMLLAVVPAGDWVQWDSSLARDARRWAIALGLEDDESGIADCRHLVSALRGNADVLITHDGRFFEAMRQHAKLLAPLRPCRLIGWQEVVFEDQAGT